MTAAGALAAAAFTPARLHPAITGEITDEQWRSAVAADLSEIYDSADRALAAVTDWSSLVPRVDHEVVSLLAQARTVATIALVCNATTRLERIGATLRDVAPVMASLGLPVPIGAFTVATAQQLAEIAGHDLTGPSSCQEASSYCSSAP